MGASRREGKSTQPVARRAGEGAWELGSGTRIQHPGDLEARPYSGGHLVQGEGFGSGDVGCWLEAEVLHRPSGSAQASRLPTLLLLGDPRSHKLLFLQRRLSGSRPLGMLGSRLCSRGSPWAQRDAIGTRRPRHGPDPASPGGRSPPPLRGVRAPRNRPNGTPARFPPGAGGAANLGLGRSEAAWGSRLSVRLLGREGSPNPA